MGGGAWAPPPLKIRGQSPLNVSQMRSPLISTSNYGNGLGRRGRGGDVKL